MIMDTFYRNFCSEELDGNGVLKAFAPKYDGNFNFAYDVVDAIAQAQPNRRALVWCDGSGNERTFTFGEIRALSDRAANLFSGHGVKKGDRVLLALGRHYQFWYAVMGLHKLGAIAVNSAAQLSNEDFLYRFRAAGISHVLCTASGDTAANVDTACREYSGLKGKFLAAPCGSPSRTGWIDFDSAIMSAGPEWTRTGTRAEDPLLMYFTSGTTGNPKMAWHDHTYPISHIVTARHWHGVDAGGLHLTVSDTGWAKASWGKLYGQWFMGAAVLSYDFTRFDATHLLDIVAKYKVTTLCAPATVYRFLIKEGGSGLDLSSVKRATTAGEALNAEVYNRFKELTGLEIMEAFGQSETAALTMNPVGSQPKPGSMGRPSPLYHVDLVDTFGNTVPTGDIGEVVVRVPEGQKQVGLFRGYYLDEARTSEAWQGGFYHTGDTAWCDQDGYLWYVGRTDDVIKASGYRIGPFEIESVLMEHPAVLECAVTGAPDPVRGTVVKATIVLTSRSTPSEELKKELQRFVKSKTAPYKYPRIVEFTDALPKTFSGKIKRAELREQDNQRLSIYAPLFARNS